MANGSLAAALEASGLSQIDLARKVGTSEAQVSRWIRGVHAPSRLYKREIAKALSVKVEAIWP